MTIAERRAIRLIAQFVADEVNVPGAEPTEGMKQQAEELVEYLRENGYTIQNESIPGGDPLAAIAAAWTLRPSPPGWEIQLIDSNDRMWTFGIGTGGPVTIPDEAVSPVRYRWGMKDAGLFSPWATVERGYTLVREDQP